MKVNQMNNPEKKKTAVTAESATPKKKSPANVFDGVLTSISPTKLVMKGRDGQEFSMKLHEEINRLVTVLHVSVKH